MIKNGNKDYGSNSLGEDKIEIMKKNNMGKMMDGWLRNKNRDILEKMG